MAEQKPLISCRLYTLRNIEIIKRAFANHANQHKKVQRKTLVWYSVATGMERLKELENRYYHQKILEISHVVVPLLCPPSCIIQYHIYQEIHQHLVAVPPVTLTTVANQPDFPGCRPTDMERSARRRDFSRIVIHLPSAT